MAKKLVTPSGIAAYAHIAHPDTKGQYADNKYKVTLKLKKGDKAVEEFVGKIHEALKEAQSEQTEAWKKKKLEVFDPVKDGDDKEDADKKGMAGFWLVTFKSKHQPKVVDSKRKPVGKSVTVFGGDVIKVAFGMSPFEKPVQGKGGLTLYLNAIQLLDKRAGDATSMFDEEDGYTEDTVGEGAGEDGEGSEGSGGDF